MGRAENNPARFLMISENPKLERNDMLDSSFYHPALGVP